jgi:hypothetical protein
LGKNVDYPTGNVLLQRTAATPIIFCIVAEEIVDTTALPSVNRREERDLGFGSVVTGESRQRFINRDGSFNVERTGLRFLTSLNLYHTLLTMSWS